LLSPVGGLLSKRAADATGDGGYGGGYGGEEPVWDCASVLLGDDAVPRLSVSAQPFFGVTHTFPSRNTEQQTQDPRV
jgi:hypothetical protein